MTREQIDKDCLDIALNDKNKIIAYELATGIGKSKISLNIIHNFWLQNPNIKVLLTIIELAHIDNWKAEINKWGYNHLLDCISIETYASLKKHKNLKYDFIILDEAHHIGSDIRMDILNNISFYKLFLLSATLGNDLKVNLENLFKEKVISYSISLQKAIDYGILPVPKIFLIPLTLNNIRLDQTLVKERGKKELRKVVNCKYEDRWKYLKDKTNYANLILNISCTQLQKYQNYCEEFEYYKKQYFITQKEVIKNKWLQTGNQRKKYLGELKTVHAYKLLKTLKDKRYICFCSSIEQADLLGNTNAIHSKKDNSLEIINKFNTKEISNLFAVNMLQEGQNLKDIEVGIIIQLDGVDRAFIQKFGRSLRAEDPVQYIFYYKNTKDEEYLKNILENINPQYVSNL